MRQLLILLLASALLIANKLQGQTLQFSRVLLVSTTQTVPANKVWKVESYMNNTYIAYNAVHHISVNSIDILVGNSINSQTPIGTNHPFPMWLPAGTTLAAGANVINISVIEFTVLP